MGANKVTKSQLLFGKSDNSVTNEKEFLDRSSGTFLYIIPYTRFSLDKTRSCADDLKTDQNRPALWGEYGQV